MAMEPGAEGFAALAQENMQEIPPEPEFVPEEGGFAQLAQAEEDPNCSQVQMEPGQEGFAALENPDDTSLVTLVPQDVTENTIPTEI